MTDFDVAALHQLVDTALAPPRRRAAPGALALGDTSVLAALATILPEHLSVPVVQDILAQLRTGLATGIDIGSLAALRSLVTRCHKCPALTGPGWAGMGNLVDPDVVFVTEGPWGPEEGTDFQARLRSAGFDPRACAVLGATRCRPARSRGPEATELANCADYLYTELAGLAPALIVPLGATVAGAVLAGVRITDDHGRLFWLGPWAIWPMYSPAYAAYRNKQTDFDDDLAGAHRFVYGH